MEALLTLMMYLTQELSPQQQALATVYVMASQSGISPQQAVCIVWAESRGKAQAIGDDGTSVGAWQFQKPTWEYLTQKMGLPATDRRHELIPSTQVALWALRNDLGRWWSTYPFCACSKRE